MRTALMVLLTLTYPVLVYVGLGSVGPRWLAILLVSVALLRAWATREKQWLWVAAGAMALALVAWWANQSLPLKLYPVLVNLALLMLFAISLKHPPSVIERLARFREPDLPPEAVRYTRWVTQVWCAFFVVNGGIALMTAVWASDAIWALYNGLIAYVLMAILFAGEWLVRQKVKAKNRHSSPMVAEMVGAEADGD